MNILVIGQLTLHWGRLEFGNIGNCYIVEPFFRELHRVFPDADIYTTLQMTKEFCEREKIVVLPMDLYYGFDGHELEKAEEEYAQTLKYEMSGNWEYKSPYIEAVLASDIVIDFSGDMWGENADIAAPNRFLVGLYKNRIAQKLRPTFMLAGSPGPFEQSEVVEFAKEVFEHFSVVTNRERISRSVLEKAQFATDNVIDCACPSFLFEGNKNVDLNQILDRPLDECNRPLIGLIVCGWNFRVAPFSKWPRDEEEFEPFLEVCEYLSEEMGANVVLLSHSNGFPIPPLEFELQHGRDYIVIKEIQRLLDKRGIAKHIYLQQEVLDAWRTKGFISKLDMLISGRLHGAVAGISQCIPTVIMDYGHEPKAHKLRGFAELVELDEYVVSPLESVTIIKIIEKCWKNKEEIEQRLRKKIPVVQQDARKNFDVIKEYVNK